MSHHTSSLKGVIYGTTIGVIKGASRSLDYCSYGNQGYTMFATSNSFEDPSTDLRQLIYRKLFFRVIFHCSLFMSLSFLLSVGNCLPYCRADVHLRVQGQLGRRLMKLGRAFPNHLEVHTGPLQMDTSTCGH